MSRSQLMLTTILTTGLVMGGQAAAQTTGLESITVTAQKRVEDVQQVPISVATVSGEDTAILLSGVNDVLGLANRVPGLNVESSNGRISPRFYIRGYGNIDFDTAASQPVSIVMDEVVLENVILKSFPIFDTEQIEVLRGPQGTLFGRNTPAGIVKFDSRKPTDTYEGFLDISYGNYGMVNTQGAISGPLVENVLSARLSGLVQHQDDWVTNATTGEDDILGGFTETGARLQFLLTPNERLEVLANLQYADLTGNSGSLFRANVLDTGSNDLNGNFDRDVVAYDGGGNNPSEREAYIASLKVEYDLTDSISLTSITAYSDLERYSRGDIDGGTVAIGQTGITAPNGFTSVEFDFLGSGFPDSTSYPGFIPFPSDTGGYSQSDQFTQEIRLASTDGGAFQWQFGGFYFENSLTDLTDANLLFLGIVPATFVAENESWAVFGQGSYDLTELLTITGGLRYTEDKKDFSVPIPPTATYTLTNGTLATSTDDGQFSWDVSAAYAATDDVNLYARIARGFRGPSIQGRNVAFADIESIAQSETVLSYEVGIKSLLLDNRMRLNAAAFYNTVEDIQLTAVGGASNSIILLNADEAIIFGFEADLEFVPNENLLLTAGISYVDSEINDSGLAVAPCGSGQCTVLDPLDGSGNALIDGNPLPQAPEYTLNFAARYGVPFESGELYFHTDWYLQGETHIFLYESAEYQTDGNFEGGARIGYVFGDGNYDIAAFARNITDEENLIGGIDFNNNTGFVNQPRIYGVTLRASF